MPALVKKSRLCLRRYRYSNSCRPADKTNAAEKQPALLDDDACFALLRNLAVQPDAATGTRIRIGKDYDIAGSQRDLAHHLGLSRSTLRRCLLRLEGQGRLSLDYTDEGTTHIKLHLTRV